MLQSPPRQAKTNAESGIKANLAELNSTRPPNPAERVADAQVHARRVTARSVMSVLTATPAAAQSSATSASAPAQSTDGQANHRDRSALTALDGSLTACVALLMSVLFALACSLACL